MWLPFSPRYFSGNYKNNQYNKFLLCVTIPCYTLIDDTRPCYLSLWWPSNKYIIYILFITMTEYPQFESNNKHFTVLTHCGLVMSYCNIDVGQHWLRRWLAITTPNVDYSSVRSCGIHLKAISQEIIKMSLKMSNLRLHLPGTNELTHCGLVTPYGDINLGPHWLR